jgi:AcrR family transcriptional regulator
LGILGSSRGPRAPSTPKAQVFDITPKKRPVQERSRVTFDALVDACAWVLCERGFHATTTNHVAERAGVNIASLYEYFPGKDALVAMVAERLVERVLGRLQASVARVMKTPPERAMRLWIELIYQAVARERVLVAVFKQQVPYTEQLPAVRALGDRLLEFSSQMRGDAGAIVHPEFNAATLHLVNNVVASTILQAVLDPPRDVSPEALLDELATRIEGWIRGPAARPG